MNSVQQVVVRPGMLMKTSMGFAPALAAFLILCSVVVATAQNPVCGSSLNDTTIHTPPNYTCSSPPCTSNPFPPPQQLGIHHSITDPQYGCPITRLTTFAEFGTDLSTHHNYSTETPFNADSSKLLVVDASGQWAVIDAQQGNVIVDVGFFPNNNDSSLVWDVSNANVLYITNGNQFIAATITGTNTVTTSVKHTFSSFTHVTIPDQTDLSDDGCKIWLEADSGSGGTAVSYNLCTDTVNSQSLNIGPKDSPDQNVVPSWHKIQTFPSGKMLMTWQNQPTTQGPEVIFNTDGTLYWDPGFGASSHADVGTDLQNHEVLLSVANGVNFGTHSCSNLFTSINVIDINAKAAVSCLIDNIPPWDISYRDSAQGWVAISTFDMGSCPDYSCFDTTMTSHLASNWQSIWPLYGEEVLLVKVDGSAVYRLAHHRSRSAEAYYAQPRAAISRDGKYIVWDSNFDISSNTTDPQYSDVYITPNPVSASGSSFALVQKSAPGFVQASSQSVTLSGVGSGHLLIVCAYDNAGSGVTTSISDTLGSTWSGTSAVSNTQGSGGPLTMRVFYAVAPAGGNDTITLNQSSGTAPLGGLYFEYSGNSSSNVLDATAGQAATGSTSNASSPNITTTGPHDLLVGFFGDTSGSGTITAGSGYTMRLTDVNFYAGAEDRLNLAAGTYNATATLPSSDAGWIGIIASFK